MWMCHGNISLIKRVVFNCSNQVEVEERLASSVYEFNRIVCVCACGCVCAQVSTHTKHTVFEWVHEDDTLHLTGQPGRNGGELDASFCILIMAPEATKHFGGGNPTGIFACVRFVMSFPIKHKHKILTISIVHCRVRNINHSHCEISVLPVFLLRTMEMESFFIY